MMYSKYQKSYSLTEMSAVLAIISIISGSAISIAISQNDIVKRRQTIQKMAIIEQAIADFASINDRIPCAGNINLAINNASAGAEYCDCQGLATSWSTTPTNYATTTGNGPYTVPGLVPVQALQLPQDFMLDAWGNKIVYVFTKVLAGTNFGTCGYGNSGPFKLEQTNMGLVNVQNASGQLSTNQAAYVLFSAGANGLGAFQASGSGRNPTPTNANELINYNAVSSTSIYLQMTQTVDPGFDDIVRYKMKWQLVKEAGGVISNAACTTAAQVMVETPDYLVNSINYPPFCRNSPGSPFCATYLYNIANYMYGICLNKY